MNVRVMKTEHLFLKQCMNAMGKCHCVRQFMDQVLPFPQAGSTVFVVVLVDTGMPTVTTPPPSLKKVL